MCTVGGNVKRVQLENSLAAPLKVKQNYSVIALLGVASKE